MAEPAKSLDRYGVVGGPIPEMTRSGLPVLVVVGNPFGLGPAGIAISLIEALAARQSTFRIIFAGGDLCSQITGKEIETVSLNERNFDELSTLFSTFPRAIIISCLNRFAVAAARQNGHQSLFIDSLTWLWPKIPEPFLAADYYISLRFPGCLEKLDGVVNARLIPHLLPHLDSPYLRKVEEKGAAPLILVHLGGCENPIIAGLPYAYLDLIAESILAAVAKQGRRYLVTGGKAGMSYLARRCCSPQVSFATLSRGEFSKLLRESALVVTTAGLGCTLEAFAYGTPVAFLPPMNLSQVKAQAIFSAHGAAESQVTWEKVLGHAISWDNMDERAALLQISCLTEKISSSPSLSQLAVELCGQLLLSQTCSKPQEDFFAENIGSGGIDEILEVLQSCNSTTKALTD